MAGDKTLKSQLRAVPPGVSLAVCNTRFSSLSLAFGEREGVVDSHTYNARLLPLAAAVILNTAVSSGKSLSCRLTSGGLFFSPGLSYITPWAKD